MAERQEWDKERAEQHARWAKMTSKLSYAPFARKIVASLDPSAWWSPNLRSTSGRISARASRRYSD